MTRVLGVKAMFKIDDRAFWDYSLLAYKNEAVKDACLLLQDNMDLNVNVMLSMMYLCHHDRMYHFEDIEKLEMAISVSEKVLKQHRAKRRDLKAIDTGFYEQALREELVLEKQQQAQISEYANTLVFNAYGEPTQLSDQLVALCMRQSMRPQFKKKNQVKSVSADELDACAALANFVGRDWNYR